MVSDILLRPASGSMTVCLNPCSNGIWSLTWIRALLGEKIWRLNPCSNGIWSLTDLLISSRITLTRLNPCSNGIWSLTLRSKTAWKTLSAVLILVLMEYGLWPRPAGLSPRLRRCLNPCSNGIWSLTLAGRRCSDLNTVLILVLMEYGLWRYCELY